MELKLFLYNELINSNKLNDIMRGHGIVIDIVPSFIKGCRYYNPYNKLPVIFKKVVKQRAFTNYVYGALITLECDKTAINCIDGYMSCSKSTLLTNSISDLYLREDVTIFPIKVEGVDKFLKFDYEVKLPVEAQAYFGNTNNRYFEKTTNNNHKLRGLFNKEFLTLL